LTVEVWKVVSCIFCGASVGNVKLDCSSIASLGCRNPLLIGRLQQSKVGCQQLTDWLGLRLVATVIGIAIGRLPTTHATRL
jgi:hypothetical protein